MNRESLLTFILVTIAVLIESGCDFKNNNNMIRDLVLTTSYEKSIPPYLYEPYYNTAFFDDFDTIDGSVWQIATWVEESQTSITRCYVSGGYLNLVFIYKGKDASNNDVFWGAAIQTWNEFMYGKWEASLKPASKSGVLNSMYTIDWDNTRTNGSGSDGTKQEIDIEFLTKSFSGSTGQVHYATHAAGKTSFNTNPDVDLSFNPSAGFHVYGIDITPEHIQWTVDDVVMREYIYSENDITINAPYQLKFNVWSQNGAGTWVGGPPAKDTECIYQIDWVSFTPYNAF